MGGRSGPGGPHVGYVLAVSIAGAALIALQYHWVGRIGPLPEARQAPQDPIDWLYALAPTGLAVSVAVILGLSIASAVAIRWLLARAQPLPAARPEHELGLLPAAAMMFIGNNALTIGGLLSVAAIYRSHKPPLEAQLGAAAFGQLASTLMIGAALVLCGRGAAAGLRLHRGTALIAPLLLLAFVAPYAGTLVGTRWIYLAHGTTPELQSVVTEVLAARAVPARFAMLAVYAIIVAPITEEILYRGLLHGGLRSFGPTAASVGSAAAFSLVHGAPLPLLPLFALGLLLSAVREASGSVAGPIALHALFNATQVGLMLTAP